MTCSAESCGQVLFDAIASQRPGYALSREFYADPAKIAKAAYAMTRPGKPAWEPDAERAKLAYQAKFRGPF